MKEIRSLTKDELQKIYIQEDLLKGNISRMCVTDSLKELFSMYDFALKRISTIYNINLEKFISNSEDVEENKEESQTTYDSGYNCGYADAMNDISM